ncbi:MAG: MBL fold metallo-hydrolase [Myxococcota bacterium]
MFLEFYGAAGQVTGSLHRLNVNHNDVLLECGLFQGHRVEAHHLNRAAPDWAIKAECVVLSHAHLDHSGNLPSLTRKGFKGNIYCTPATRDLCSVMLRDSAMIQQQDARYLQKKGDRGTPVEPLYDVEDAQQAVSQMVTVSPHRTLTIARGVDLTFHDAGHVLGSSLVQLDLMEQGKRFRLLFTGDLGRAALPLLKSPEIISDVDLLLMESTYGDRLHGDYNNIDEQLEAIVNKTIGRGGRVYIPTFALERAQEVLFVLERLHEEGRLPDVPIYIDSPLAIAITEIYKLHPESLAPTIRDRIVERNDPFSPPGLKYVSNVQHSIALQRSGEPCIVIAGSGMCEGGRIVHHLQGGLEDRRNSVVIVGFMAQHTLGRRLVERRDRVRVLGVERDVLAEVHVLNGLSAHADKDDLIDFTRATAKIGNVRRVALIHGEDDARDALAEALREIGVPRVLTPQKGDIEQL